MDTPAQNDPQDDGQQSSTGTTPVQPAQSPQTPAAPSGSLAKEHGPVRPNEYLQPAGPEAVPDIPAEIAKHVEASRNHEKPQLDNHDKKAGLQEAKESVPVPTTLSDDKLGQYTPQQIAAANKYSVRDSLRWRLTVFGRELKRRIYLALFKN